MYHKVQGIVLKTVKYSDSAVIATLYTDLFGRQSYFIRHVNKSKSRQKIGFLQALSLLKLECTHKENNLNTVREINFIQPYTSIPFHPEKTAIAFFIAEVLEKTLKEEEANPVIFQFITDHLLALDKLEINLSWFHIFFLINLMKYLGIQPDILTDNSCHDPTGFFSDKQAETIIYFLNYPFPLKTTSRFHHSEKMTLLEKIIIYYQVRYEISDIKSYAILREIFN